MTVRLRILLIVPLVALLIGPLYAGRRPDFLGVAFFYWYELAAVVISVAITLVVTEPSWRTARPAHRRRGPALLTRPVDPQAPVARAHTSSTIAAVVP